MLEKLKYIFSIREKIRFVAILILMIIGSFAELIGIAVFLPFISMVMDPETAISESIILQYLYDILPITDYKDFLIILALVICLIYILKNIYLSIMQNIMLSFSYKMRMDIATRLLDTYMHEPYSFHRAKNIAELQRSLQSDVMQFMLLINNALQLLSEMMVIVAIGIYLFHTSHAITVIVMGLLTLCVGTFYLVSKKVSLKIGLKNQEYNSKLNQWVNQALGGIKEVKVLGREDFFVFNYKTNYKKLIKGAKDNELLATVPKYIIETVCIVGMLIAVVVKLEFGQDVEMVTFIPQLSAFAVASFRLLPSIGKINAYFNSINYSIPSLEYIYRDLKDVEGYKNSLTSNENEIDKVFSKAIHVQKIAYTYPDGKEKVIDNVSFDIIKGQTIALIGSSGSGKTTLADILLGLLEPQNGQIIVDDWNTKDYIASWHKLIGYIPQTIYLTDDTIRNNIAFGVNSNDIDDEAIIRAMREAQLETFVDSLPDGKDTIVGDRGVRLSGGQRQRIGIARALYHNPEILVLDEATSALDNETEKAVMEAIEGFHGNKTMVIIAHRLTTITNSDVIYEVKNGKLIQRSKDELGI